MRSSIKLFATNIIFLFLISVFSTASASPLSGAYAYVTTNETSVYVIDTTTNNVTATVPVGMGPGGVAVNPAGTKVYVANEFGGSINGTISVIDTADNTVTDTVSVGRSPIGVAVTPDGTKVYVTNLDSGTVSVIDTLTNNVTATVPVGLGPVGVAVSPDGKKVYVANDFSGQSNGTVSVIDTANNTVTATTKVGRDPQGVAITPDGKRVYVADDNISVIDTTSNNVTAMVNVNVGLGPLGIVVTPDGTKVYVANYWAGMGNGTVSVIDTATNTVIATVNVGSYPRGVAITPDGTKVYVTNSYSDYISVIDTATDTIATNVSVGIGTTAFGQFIGFLPKNHVILVANFKTNVTRGCAPLSVQFTDFSQNATSRIWSFGDGTHSTVKNPVHTYCKAGKYSVTLSVKDMEGNTAKKCRCITVADTLPKKCSKNNNCKVTKGTKACRDPQKSIR